MEKLNKNTVYIKTNYLTDFLKIEEKEKHKIKIISEKSEEIFNYRDGLKELKNEEIKFLEDFENNQKIIKKKKKLIAFKFINKKNGVYFDNKLINKLNNLILEKTKLEEELIRFNIINNL